MAVKRMGWEGKFYGGAAGATAATPVTNITDVELEIETTTVEVTERGDGTAPPTEEHEAVMRKLNSLTFKMWNKDGDTMLTTFLTASAAGTPVAVRLQDKAAGKGPDIDVFLTVKHAQPLNGAQAFDFTAKPTARLRAVQLYV